DLLQVVEVADRADVIEAFVLEHGETGRVVAAVLEALQAVDEKRLDPSRADVSDDPAHGPTKPPLNAESPASATPDVGDRSTELSSNEVGDGTTEATRL